MSSGLSRRANEAVQRGNWLIPANEPRDQFEPFKSDPVAWQRARVGWNRTSVVVLPKQLETELTLDVGEKVGDDAPRQNDLAGDFAAMINRLARPARCRTKQNTSGGLVPAICYCGVGGVRGVGGSGGKFGLLLCCSR